MIAKTVHTLRQRCCGSAWVCGTDAQGRGYALGFASVEAARRALRRLDPARPVLVRPGDHQDDVAGDLNERERSATPPGRRAVRYSRVVIDRAATVVLPKAARCADEEACEERAAAGGPGATATGVEAVEVAFEHFLSLPFDEGMGIALPLATLDESEADVTYSAQLVAPVEYEDLGGGDGGDGA